MHKLKSLDVHHYTEKYLYFIVVFVSFITLFLLPHNLITNFVNLFIMLVLPGWLVVRLWKENIPFYEKLLYAITLSLSLLLALGLLLNMLLPLLGLARPLEASVVKPLIWGAIATLSIFSQLKKKVVIKPYKFNYRSALFLAVGLIIPLLAIGSANRLNTLPEDWLASITLLIIMLYALTAGWFAYKKQFQTFIPISIFLTALSLLWMYSLRSHYIFGFDINQEFHYFVHTLQAGRWSSSHNPYEACLSITILPTLIANYSNIAAESVFKVIYPALFSLVPLAIYSIGRRYFSAFIAFLGSLLYIFQIQFLFQATALARQEIATLFFAVALLAFFNNKWSRKKRNSIFLLFSFGMILSHYSTTYIAVASYLITFALIMIWSYVRSKPLPKYHIPGAILSVIVIGVIGWNLQVTQSSTNLFLTIRQSFISIPQIFQADAQRSTVAQSILGNKQLSGSEATYNYVSQYDHNAQYNLSESVFNIPLIGPNGGNRLASAFFHTIVPYIVKLFVIASVPYLLLNRRKRIPASYRLVAVAMLLYGVILVLVPKISLDYNVDRLYQQSLILLAVPTIYLMLRAVARLRIFGTVLVVSILFSYFLMTTSFIDRLVFNWSNVNLGNANEAFYTFNVTDGDSVAVKWMNDYSVNNEVYGDRYGALHLVAFGTRLSVRSVKDDLLSGVITKGSYVYLDSTNLIYGRAYYTFNGQVFSYSVPKKTIGDVKNTVYSNQKARIYH